MKPIHHLLLLLSAILIFNACSDSSTGNDDSFEGQRFGNWITTSETSAEWIGSGQNIKSTNQISAAGDTTYFEQPNGNELVLYSDPNDDGEQYDLFAITYTDSSYSFAYFDTTEATSRVVFNDPFNEEDTGGAIGVSDDLMNADLTIDRFSCDSTYNISPDNNFEFHIMTDDGRIYESIIVDTDGVVEAMRAIGC